MSLYCQFRDMRMAEESDFALLDKELEKVDHLKNKFVHRGTASPFLLLQQIDKTTR